MFSRIGNVSIPAGKQHLSALLHVPLNARGTILVVRGAAGQPCNRLELVASAFNEVGFGVLRCDLLTAQEAGNEARLCDADLLADRILDVAHWLERHLQVFPIGVFSTGAAAAGAIVAGTRCPDCFDALVAYAGRPDLAWSDLPHLTVPTLLLAASQDFRLLRLNQDAVRQLRCPCGLRTIGGSGLYSRDEEATDRIIDQATQWFERHLSPPILSGPRLEVQDERATEEFEVLV